MDDLRKKLMAQESEVPTSALARIWRGGRAAVHFLRGPEGERLESLVAQLGELKGIAMKAGQMLGYLDASLPPETRAMLSTLQTAASATPFAAIEAEARMPGLVLEPQPIAVASVGQVHRGRLDGIEVAVKVRHPGIREAIAADFRSAALGRVVAVLAGASGVRDMIEEARNAFLEECDFALEGQRQRRFSELFADDPDLAIPEVFHASETVLVTRWLAGRSFDEILTAEQPERDRFGEALFRFWLRSLYRDGLFHADPHPGNFAFRDRQAVIYDFGCVRELDRSLRRGFQALAAATRADDSAAMASALEALGGAPPRDRRELRRLLRSFFGPLLAPGRRGIAPDEGFDARQMMRDKRTIMKMRLPARMLFLFRLRFGLYAVLSRLGAQCDWSALEASWTR